MTSHGVDLQSMQRKALELERRKAELEAQLLSLKATRTLKPSTSAAAPTIPYEAPAIANFSATSTNSLECAYRMEGITLFSAIDPSPGHKKMLGIRLDSFSKRSRKFLRPHYVILSLTPNAKSEGNEYWQVIKHTLPASVDVRAPAKKFLPPTATRLQDLEGFAREIKRKVDGMRERKEGVEELGKVFGDGSVSVDEKGEIMDMTFAGDATARLVLDEDGNVVRVVVRDDEGDRRRDLEIRMLGPLSTLPERMDWL